jgi:hypothetical protein
MAFGFKKASARDLIGGPPLVSFASALTIACIVTFLVVGAAIWIVADGIDPFDRFELLKITSDPQSERHAAVYRYHHSNSSATVTAIWLLTGRPPSDPKEPVSGSPALVWPGNPEAIQVRWQEDGRRFLVEAKGPIDVRSEDFRDCYFRDPDPPSLICLQPRQIDLHVTD